MADLSMDSFMAHLRVGTIPIGAPMDPQDHIADSGHNDSHSPGRAELGRQMSRPDSSVLQRMSGASASSISDQFRD